MVPMNGRVIADKNVTIGGYQFSKNVGLLFFYPYSRFLCVHVLCLLV